MRDRKLARGCCRARARRRPIRRSRSLFSGHFFFRHVQELRRPRRPISCARPGASKITMRLPSLFPSKKLRATTARRSLGVPDEMDYEEMSEPNMKLSRALLIVLVLHVVAVAGIIAFNTIKSRQAAVPPVSSSKPKVQTSVPKSTAATVTNSAASTKPREETSATKPAVKEERKAIPVKPIAENTPKVDSKKSYVVAKGDTPL